MKLNDLRDNPGARHSIKRVGRGQGSGLGKTSAKGQKGQKSRTGVAIKGFEGGQMPIYRRLPKRGFNNKMFAKQFAIVNLGLVQRAIDAGKIDASKPVDHAALIAAGLCRPAEDGVRLLARGTITTAVTFHVDHASASAAQAVEAAGGSVSAPVAPDVSETSTEA